MQLIISVEIRLLVLFFESLILFVNQIYDCTTKIKSHLAEKTVLKDLLLDCTSACDCFENQASLYVLYNRTLIFRTLFAGHIFNNTQF